MTREEKLFRALGGVDAGLVEAARRPPERRSRYWPALWAGLAACLLLGFGIWRAAPWSAVPVDPDPPVGPSGPVTPLPPEESAPIVLKDAPQVEGGSAHFLRLTCSLPGGAEEETADFYISVDQEFYQLVQEGDSARIEPLDAPEDLPPCDLEIRHFPGVTLDQAVSDAKAWCKSYAFCEEAGDGVLRAWDGTDWDDAQADIRLVEDSRGGVYRLTARYFLEAAEGHGVRLNAMMNTFTPLAEDDPTAPLRSVADRVTAAVLADDLTAVADLLTENALVTGFGEDVSGGAVVSGMDISLAEDGRSASVSVSLLLLEDAPCWLHLDLILEGGSWLASWGAVAMA